MDSELRVYVNGKIVPASEASVSVFDASFQSGDAVWEGMRVYHGIVFRLEQHLERLDASAATTRIVSPLARAELIDAMYSVLEANAFEHDVHIRMMLSRGTRSTSGMDPSNAPPVGTLVIIPETKPVAQVPRPISLATVPIRRPRPDVLDPNVHHSNQLNTILARLFARDAGADAALMLDADGYAVETDTANVFCVSEGKLLTPPPDACTRGVTRGIVLDLARQRGMETIEANLHLFQLYSASEAFVVGTLGELAPVSSLDTRQIGTGSGGPAWQVLLADYRALIEHECANQTNGVPPADTSSGTVAHHEVERGATHLGTEVAPR